MLEVKVSTSGLSFDAVAQKVSGPLKVRFIERLVDVVWAAAFWGAPRRTGYLASTVYKEVAAGEGKVGAAASYAGAVEYGSRPHTIYPVNGRVLVFQFAGKMVFTSVVSHPGTEANPFLHRAVDEGKRKADEVFSALWLEVVGS